MPAMPEGAAEGILRGLYKLKPAEGGEAVAQLFGSGPILNEVLRAQEILADEVQRARRCVERDQLQRAAARCAGRRALEPAASCGEGASELSADDAWQSTKGPIIAASDYMKVVPDQLSPWLPGRLVSLGTDGFGRSDNREHLRRHFEVNAESIVGATLSSWPARASSSRSRRKRRWRSLGSMSKRGSGEGIITTIVNAIDEGSSCGALDFCRSEALGPWRSLLE